MKLALIGYGKMGKIIEEIAISRGHTIEGKASSHNPIEELDFSQIDVAIEFTTPSFAVHHIEHCLDKNTPIVVGTTAWNEQLPYVKTLVAQKEGALLHASNFSIGVNVFFDINKRLAKLMANHTDYVASLEETHHVHKLDAPSGTAVTIANDIMLENDRLESWKLGEESAPEVKPWQLPVTSFRKPDVPGTHIVSYESPIDTIQLSHTAHSREGFALGAVIAAEFLQGKNGTFTMQDVIKF
ncbi:MAG: 4-hydroxy-tetrahydrodipicolinate reductase [Crocinitomicaceae bacterium]|nr:4-hydroxy-tetrahydrodipicolinate reductase [Crocinitomicaceae bacterium]